MDLYKDVLLDHYKNPRNYGKLALLRSDFAKASTDRQGSQGQIISSGEHIPSCGDSVELECIIIDGIVCEIAFTGKGCVISQATTSMLTEFCKQKNIKDILKLDSDFILKLIGIELGPNRLKCALLPLMALHKGLNVK